MCLRALAFVEEILPVQASHNHPPYTMTSHVAGTLLRQVDTILRSVSGTHLDDTPSAVCRCENTFADNGIFLPTMTTATQQTIYITWMPHGAYHGPIHFTMGSRTNIPHGRTLGITHVVVHG